MTIQYLAALCMPHLVIEVVRACQEGCVATAFHHFTLRKKGSQNQDSRSSGTEMLPTSGPQFHSRGYSKYRWEGACDSHERWKACCSELGVTLSAGNKLLCSPADINGNVDAFCPSGQNVKAH